jgi:hypothetical protein
MRFRILTAATIILTATHFLELIPAASSQECPKSPSLESALWQPYRSPGIVSVRLSNTILLPQSNTQWFLYDSSGMVPLPIHKVDYPQVHPQSGPDYGETALLTPAAPLVLNHVYYVFVNGLTFRYCSAPAPKLDPVSVTTSRPKDASKNFLAAAAKGRDDSDFYFAPTIDGASGTGASYTLDTKFQFRKSLLNAQFGSGVSYRPAIYWIPGWDLKISSNPKEDGNSVNFLVPVEIIAPVDPGKHSTLSGVLTAVISRPGFVAEADKKFHDVNGVFADYEYFVLRGTGNKWFWLSPEPTVGIETGSNLKAQSAATYPESILRTDFGMNLFVELFPIPAKRKSLLSLDTSYIRRLLLHPEPVYTQDAKGNLILAGDGTQPRDHVNAKLTYSLNSYVGLTASYEYGELPPVYTKVDHKYTFGVTFQGQLQYRPGTSK